MNESTVIVVGLGDFFADVLRQRLSPWCRAIMIAEPNTFDDVVRSEPQIRLVAIEVGATTRDPNGVERPFWQVLARRVPLPYPVICFSSSTSAPSDTPLFTPPPGTMTVVNPGEYDALARHIKMQVELFAAHPGLTDALLGRMLPAMQGAFADFSFDSVLKLLQLGGHTCVVMIRDGLNVGIVACVKGEPVHALAGSFSGNEAFSELYHWRQAAFIVLRGMLLGERTITRSMENLLLDASRIDDEVHELIGRLPPQSYVRRVRGYTDQLPGKRLTQTEMQVLSLVDHYHIVNELIQRVNASSVMVMRALRSLMNQGLVECVETNQ